MVKEVGQDRGIQAPWPMSGYCWNHNQSAPRKARGAHKGKAGSGSLVQCGKAVGGFRGIVIVINKASEALWRDTGFCCCNFCTLVSCSAHPHGTGWAPGAAIITSLSQLSALSLIQSPPERETETGSEPMERVLATVLMKGE